MTENDLHFQHFLHLLNFFRCRKCWKCRINSANNNYI